MYVLGLYSDGDYFKVSLISKNGRKSRIEFLREFKKDIANLNALKKILDSKVSFFGREVEVVSSLPQDEVFIKKIVIPLVGDRKVRKALQFQLSSEELYSEEDRFFVPLFKKSGKETIVTLYGYTKEAMEGHLHDVKTLGINSEWVSTVSRALERFVQFFAAESVPFFLFHLGWEKSSFYFFSGGEVKREVSFSIGLKNIIDAIQKDQILTDPVDMTKMQELFIQGIEEEKETAVVNIFFNLEKEISRAWTYILETEEQASNVDKILFTGYAEFSIALKPYIPPIDLDQLLISPHLEYSSSQITTYAIEIGLSLDRIVNDEQTLQLGSGMFIPFAQKKKAKRYLYRYAGLSLISAIMVFFTIDAYLIKKRGLLKKRYEQVVKEIDSFRGTATTIAFKEKTLRKNKKSLIQAIKQQKQKEKLQEGPLSFGVIAEWIASSEVEDFAIEEMEYKLVQRPTKEYPLQDYIVELMLSFKKPEDIDKIEAFKTMAMKPIKGISFFKEPEIIDSGEFIMINMRVKA